MNEKISQGSNPGNRKIRTEQLISSTVESPYLSLCIPTNGIIKWVFPVLDSIYSQEINETLFEVVVMDNGTNEEFRELMNEYAHKHINLTYAKTDAFEFLSEIETYKNAKGAFIKFINHRTQLLSGTLQTLIDFVKENRTEQPEVYFANGVLSSKHEVQKYTSFDQYVKALSYFSSWSTGMGFWKEKFDRIDLSCPNILFPHTNILFADTTNSSYIVDNRVLLYEMPTGDTPKGRYNLFHAFAVEYLNIILQLYLDKKITVDTFLSVKKDNYKFVSLMYFDYIVRKKTCSYDLTGYKESISCFYSYPKMKFSPVKIFCEKIIHKIF